MSSPEWLTSKESALDEGQITKAAHILTSIREEGYSLRKAAEEIGVGASTFLDWCAKDEGLAEQYARAREERGFVLAEQTLEIADDPEIEPNDKRVRIDARKWFASKLNPKRLGDKIAHVGGGESDHPIQTVTKIELVAPPKNDDSAD